MADFNYDDQYYNQDQYDPQDPAWDDYGTKWTYDENGDIKFSDDVTGQAPLDSQQTVPGAGQMPGGQQSPGVPNTNMSVMQQIMSGLKKPNILGTIGSTMGHMGAQAGTDRLIKGGFTQNADQMMMQYDPMKKLAQANYVLSGGMDPNKQWTPFKNTGPSDAQKQYAQGLQDELLKRKWYAPTDPSKFDPGMLEKIGRYGGDIVGATGAIASGQNPYWQPQQPQRQQQTGSVMGDINKYAGMANTGLGLASKIGDFI